MKAMTEIKCCFLNNHNNAKFRVLKLLWLRDEKQYHIIEWSEKGSRTVEKYDYIWQAMKGWSDEIIDAMGTDGLMICAEV